MALSCGIVGLPNVGKSTLFNALSAAGVAAQNFPFCTIEPNVASVPVPDPRLDALAKLLRPPKVVPAHIDLVDIAGLVRGASRGEGLGNQFLSHVREADALAHVVRCFDDPNVVHVDGRVDPAADAAVVATELLLRDLETVQARAERAHKLLKVGRTEDRLAAEVCDRLAAHLDAGRPAREFAAEGETAAIVRELHLLTSKRVFYVANVDERALGAPDADARLGALRAHAAAEGAEVVPVCAALEAQIAELDAADRPAFLEASGLTEPALHAVVRTARRVLDLVTFFTVVGAEMRAWTVPAGTRAPQAAGKIHTDFERAFIRAEVVRWSDLVELGSEARCREAGRFLVEGRDYVVRDGDVIHFRTGA